MTVEHDRIVMRRQLREKAIKDEQQEKARQKIAEEAKARLSNFLKEGDVLMHTRCMGFIEEHVFTGWDGAWLCGVETDDTALLKGTDRKDRWTNDISPRNVTHINRVPIEEHEDPLQSDIGFTNKLRAFEENGRWYVRKA